jgi:hypothetical protein
MVDAPPEGAKQMTGKRGGGIAPRRKKVFSFHQILK